MKSCIAIGTKDEAKISLVSEASNRVPKGAKQKSDEQRLKQVIKRVLIGLCVSFFYITSTNAAEQTFSNFIAFGDSLSDTGNLASSLPINLPFPFFDNRISDGPVAIDHLSASFGFDAQASEVGGFNFSVAGGNIVGNQVEDLGQQIGSYLARVNGIADPSALYFVMIGGNDLRSLRSQTDANTAATEISAISNKLMLELSRLQLAGAKNFFLVNVANVGRIPETLQKEANDPGIGARAEQYTRIFNTQFDANVIEFVEQTSAKVFLYDLFVEFESILDSPFDFGFIVSTEGCFDIGEIENLADLFGQAFHPLCVLGTRFDRFVFFDNLHPASGVNQIIGESMIARMSMPPVSASPASTFNIISVIILLLQE